MAIPSETEIVVNDAICIRVLAVPQRTFTCREVPSTCVR